MTSVGLLMQIEAVNLIARGKDINIWKVHIDATKYDVQQIKRELIDNKSNWNKLIQTQNNTEYYVFVNRFFKKPRCYKFSAEDINVELTNGSITYPPVAGLYGIGFIPEERFSYEIRNHITQIQFCGEMEYIRFKESMFSDATILMSDNATLEGRLFKLEGKSLHFPDKILLEK